MRFNGRSRDKFEKEFVNLHSIRNRVARKLLLSSTSKASWNPTDEYSKSKTEERLQRRTDHLVQLRGHVSPLKAGGSVTSMPPYDIRVHLCEVMSWLETNLSSRFVLSSLIFSIGFIILISYLMKYFFKTKKKEKNIDLLEEKEISECFERIDSAISAMQEVTDKMNNFQQLFRFMNCFSNKNGDRSSATPGEDKLMRRSPTTEFYLPPAYVTNKEFPNNHIYGFVKSPEGDACIS